MRACLVLICVALGCSSASEDGFDSFEVGGTGDGLSSSTSGARTTTTVPEATGAEEMSADGPLLDVMFETEGADTLGEEGCRKIDFLFVIDNSGSMRDNQQRLVAAFPGFIQAIQDEVAGDDHHIMVIDSDESPAWLCEEFLDGGHCDGTNIQPNDCDQYVCGSIDDLDACAVTLGAGVVHPVGGFASNADCDFPPDRRYLTSEDADVEGKFGCAATVGISGNGDELPFTGMVASLGDDLAGSCNAGFLRDDAILVVTIVTDDPDNEFSNDDATMGDPQAWHDAVVAAKGGNEDASVVIGLVPYEDTTCVFENEPTARFVEFVELFGDHGVLGSVCSEDYADLFAETIAVIDTTCDEFDPAG